MTFIAWVYITTNRTHSVIYVGFTTDISTRIWEHQSKQNPNSFSARYNVTKLVYYQGFLSLAEAQAAEKFIKGKKREWKRRLIEKHNPRWKDLTSEIAL